MLKILAPQSSGALTAKDMDKMAVDLATAAAKSMEEIPDPQNPNQMLENPQMEDYLRHYRRVVPSVFGSAAGGQQVVTSHTRPKKHLVKGGLNCKESSLSNLVLTLTFPMSFER